MFLLFQLLCLLLCTISPTAATGNKYDSERCGKSVGIPKSAGGSPNFLIMGGSDAAMGAYPWAVRVMSQGNKCSGTLIGSRWVLTAAHCLLEENKKPDMSAMLSQTVVHAGGICPADAKSPKCFKYHGTAYKIVNVTAHEKYLKTKNVADDIAILELERDADWPANHICIPKKHGMIDFPYRSEYQVAGYGDNGQVVENYFSSDLFSGIQARRPIVAFCGRTIKEKRVTYNEVLQHLTLGPMDSGIRPSLMRFTDRQPRGVCAGDSGAGIYAEVMGRAFIRGVVSEISGKCDFNKPYTSMHWMTGPDILYESGRIL